MSSVDLGGLNWERGREGLNAGFAQVALYVRERGQE